MRLQEKKLAKFFAMRFKQGNYFVVMITEMVWMMRVLLPKQEAMTKERAGTMELLLSKQEGRTRLARRIIF